MLDHQAGSLLIHLPKGIRPEYLAKKYSHFEGHPTMLSYEKEVSATLCIYLYSFDYQSINELDFLRALKHDGQIIEAQFDHFVHARNTWPNDPYIDQQWNWLNPVSGPGLPDADIDADLAWDICTGGLTPSGEEIVVAVLDDGIDLEHEDLAENIWKNEDEIPFNGIDDDQNGYIDDYRGWNVSTQNDIVAYGAHGTQVAGLLGAKGNNAKGISGLNWNVKMMIVKGNWTLESEVIAGYSYVLEARQRYNASTGTEGAFVVAANLSWGLDGVPASEAPLWCAIYDSLGTAGILSVASTANQSWDVDIMGDLPTSCTSDYLLAVTSSTNYDELAPTAAYGPLSIDLAAPGAEIFTTAYGNQYGIASGTSFAAPQVTALAALLYAAPCPTLMEYAWQNPAAAVQLVKESILRGVDSKPALEGLLVTGGRLNAHKSLQWLLNACGSNCEPPPALQLQADASSNELLISWPDANGAFPSLDIYYRIAGEAAWQILPAQSNFSAIPDLEPCTPYEFKAAHTCYSSGQTLFSPVTGMATAGCCENPENIQVVTEQYALSISWEPIPDASAYLFQYRFEGEQTWTEIITTDTQVSLFDLSPCTTYEYRITTLCDNPSIAEASHFFTPEGCDNCTEQEYCVPEMFNAAEWIDTVILNGQIVSSGPNENGYRLFSGTPFYLNLLDTLEVSVSIKAIGTFEEFISLWIDFNQDGDFDDAGELLWAPEQSFPSNSWAHARLSLPVDLQEDYYRMRIVLQWNDSQSNPYFESCPDLTSQSPYGETEDYCVFLSRNYCPLAENVEVMTTNPGSAEVEWSAQATGSEYSIRLRLQGDSVYTEYYAGESTQFTLTDLEPCYRYELSVLTLCSNDTIESEWVNFQLPDLCAENGQLTLSPNPFFDELELSLPTNTWRGNILLSWYTATGRLIYEQKIPVEEGIHRLSPNVSRLPNGLLFLRIQLPSGEEKVVRMVRIEG